MKSNTTVHFGKPVSLEVASAAAKLGEGISAAIDAMGAPDANELFDLVLTSAASFFAVVPLDRNQRRVIASRFEECLRHQAGRTTVGDVRR